MAGVLPVKLELPWVSEINIAVDIVKGLPCCCLPQGWYNECNGLVGIQEGREWVIQDYLKS